MKKTLVLLAVFVGMTAQVWADSFTLNSITISILNPNPATTPFPFALTQVLTTPYTFPLNVGQSTASQPILEWSSPGDNKYSGNFTADVHVTFEMTQPGNPTDPVDIGAVARIDVSGNNNDTLSIAFLDPVHSYFGFGGSGQLDIDLSDVSATIHNGDSHDSGYVNGIFTYVTAPTTDPSGADIGQVPEPTSLLLLSTGLGMIGLAAWRKRQ